MNNELIILKITCLILIGILGGIFSNWLIKKSDLYKESDLYKKELRTWFYKIKKSAYPFEDMQ